MPLRIGVLAYPLFLIALQLSKPSAAAIFEKAGAVSLETSRRLESLEAPRKSLRRAVCKRLVVSVGDGRYALDTPAVRRSDRRTLALMIAGLAPLALLVWLLW